MEIKDRYYNVETGSINVISCFSSAQLNIFSYC